MQHGEACDLSRCRDDQVDDVCTAVPTTTCEQPLNLDRAVEHDLIDECPVVAQLEVCTSEAMLSLRPGAEQLLEIGDRAGRKRAAEEHRLHHRSDGRLRHAGKDAVVYEVGGHGVIGIARLACFMISGFARSSFSLYQAMRRLPASRFAISRRASFTVSFTPVVPSASLAL